MTPNEQPRCPRCGAIEGQVGNYLFQVHGWPCAERRVAERRQGERRVDLALTAVMHNDGDDTRDMDRRSGSDRRRRGEQP